MVGSIARVDTVGEEEKVILPPGTRHPSHPGTVRK